MHTLLSDAPEIGVTTRSGRILARHLEAVDQLMLVLPPRPKASTWRSLPGGEKLREAANKRPTDSVPALQTRLANKRQTLVVGGMIDADADAFEQLTLGRKLVAAVTKEKAGTLAICIHGIEAEARTRIAGRMLAAALAGGYTLPAYKSEDAKPVIRRIVLLGLETPPDIERIQAEAAGNNLARWLATMPPNKLDADAYASVLKSLAGEHGWQFKRFGIRELDKLNAGAFLAVAQGNDDDSASIVRLRYRPGAKAARPDLALVGKGIIFDTGGTNLKPFGSMLDMHGDMQGSAVAVGSLLAISRLGLPLAIDCWVAITENRTGPRAYKSQDVVAAANGKTIQVIHTDAEGRMALADTLVLASRDEPGLIVDYATLTGACITAITRRYSGVFTNRPDWQPRLKRTGRTSGERVWPFPSGKEFVDLLESDVADLKQCIPDGAGDHILAASFLAEFVGNDTAWVHMDLSSGDNKDGLGHVPSKATGFGVRYTMSLLLDEQILESDAK